MLGICVSINVREPLLGDALLIRKISPLSSGLVGSGFTHSTTLVWFLFALGNSVSMSDSRVSGGSANVASISENVGCICLRISLNLGPTSVYGLSSPR